MLAMVEPAVLVLPMVILLVMVNVVPLNKEILLAKDWEAVWCGHGHSCLSLCKTITWPSQGPKRHKEQ